MTESNLRVNFLRLQNDIETLAQIGRKEDHGLYRMAFSEADWQARKWLQSRIEDAGLDLHIDGAANIHARLGWDGERPSIMTGSHLDTVPGGGHLDGALGVLVGLESLRCIQESQLPITYPLESVAFTDEEGRFGGMLGSQAICGNLTPEHILSAKDLQGVSLTELMESAGLNPMDALRAQRKPDSINAFVELHIEQGPILDRESISVGVVEGITGLFKWNVRLIGVANHAGTTPMDMRKDAFQGLAEVSSEIPRILEENGGMRSVGTIGRVDLFPGAANVVPGRVEFSLEVRDTDSNTLEVLANAFQRSISAIARRRGLMFEYEVLSEITPVKCDPVIMQTIEDAAAQQDTSTFRMPSGAAHDTQMMASLVRSGMIFVPSKEGRSHSAAEWTAWEDIETGANVLLNTLYKLAA